MNEFCLSKKIEIEQIGIGEYEGFILAKDVKEFIRRLKEEIDNCRFSLKRQTFHKFIDKLAGDELIK